MTKSLVAPEGLEKQVTMNVGCKAAVINEGELVGVTTGLILSEFGVVG